MPWYKARTAIDGGKALQVKAGDEFETDEEAGDELVLAGGATLLVLDEAEAAERAKAPAKKKARA